MKNNKFQNMREQMEPDSHVIRSLHEKLAQAPSPIIRRKSFIPALSACFAVIVAWVLLIPPQEEYRIPTEVREVDSSSTVEASFDYQEIFHSSNADLVRDVLQSQVVPMGNFLVEYEVREVSLNQQEDMKQVLGEIYVETDEFVVHRIATRTDLVYVIIETKDVFYVGRFFNVPFGHQSHTFGEVLEVIYNVASVADLSHVVLERSLRDNTAAGNGEAAQLMRQITLHLESGVQISFSFDPISRHVSRGGFDHYMPLDEVTANWLIELA